MNFTVKNGEVREAKGQNRIQTPGGTITFTVFDVPSFPASLWIGTDDTGATETDPTGGDGCIPRIARFGGKPLVSRESRLIWQDYSPDFRDSIGGNDDR